MMKLALALAAVFVLSMLGPAYCTEKQGAQSEGEQIAAASVTKEDLTQLESRIERKVDNRINEVSNDTTRTYFSVMQYILTSVIGVFALISAFLLWRAHEVKKDARKELEEIYKIKEKILETNLENREYLLSSRESMGIFADEVKEKFKDVLLKGEEIVKEVVKDAKETMAQLRKQEHAEHDKLREETRAELAAMRDEAAKSAEDAKDSEQKTKKTATAAEHFFMAFRLQNEGKYKEAIEEYNKAIAEDPKYVPAIGNKGNALRDLGKHDEAIAEYNKVIKINPKDPLAHYNKGIVFFKLGKLRDAIACFDTAIKLNYTGAYSYKGIALFYLNDSMGAHAAFDKALDIDPADATANSCKGYMLVKEGELDKAIELLYKSLSVDKEERFARKHLALALLKRKGVGDEEKAKGMLSGLLQENSKDHAAAYVFALLGDKDNLYTLLKELMGMDLSFKRRLITDIEFEPYRDDPEFKAIVGE